MAPPVLTSLYNDSGKIVHVDIGGKSFDIENDKSQTINCSLTTDGYTTINISDQADQAYKLKYDLPNIMINDPAGKDKGIPDSAVLMERSDKPIKITITEREMRIKCDGPYLGIYQSGGAPIDYVSVVARHRTGGGIDVFGGEKTIVQGESTEGPDA